ncbi:Transposase, partial [Haemophilus influenzae]
AFSTCRTNIKSLD